MRPRYIPFALLLTLMASSCATLNVSDIRSMNRVTFEPLSLQPALEASGLRIDLIRQTTDVQVNDSTTETHDTDYHPVGFDIGNGIFFDLNGNLSFRLETLLGVSGSECYEAMQTSRRHQRRADRIYTNCDGRLTVRYPPGRREREVNHRVIDGNTTSVMYRNRLLYAVEFREESLVYRGRRNKWETIHRSGEDQYYVRHGFWRNHYRLEGGQVFLDNDYIITQDDANRRIRIIRPGWLGRTFYTIERSENHIYIYGQGYRGKRIDLIPQGLDVYDNRRFSSGWGTVGGGR